MPFKATYATQSRVYDRVASLFVDFLIEFKFKFKNNDRSSSARASSEMASALLAKLRPLGDRVLVQRIAVELKSAGGLILTDSAVQKNNQGQVISVGPGAKRDDGSLIPMVVDVGATVLLPEYGGTRVTLPADTDIEALIYREEEILAVVE